MQTLEVCNLRLVLDRIHSKDSLKLKPKIKPYFQLLYDFKVFKNFRLKPFFLAFFLSQSYHDASSETTFANYQNESRENYFYLMPFIFSANFLSVSRVCRSSSFSKSLLCTDSSSCHTPMSIPLESGTLPLKCQGLVSGSKGVKPYCDYIFKK